MESMQEPLSDQSCYNSPAIHTYAFYYLLVMETFEIHIYGMRTMSGVVI
jgi:hypothetical protein